MDLWHRHGQAAAKPGEGEDRLEDRWPETQRPLVQAAAPRSEGDRLTDRGFPPQHEHERQHEDKTRDAGAYERRPPAHPVEEVLEDGRPDRAGSEIAAY